jgi:cytochrome b involved in lipid metabolism
MTYHLIVVGGGIAGIYFIHQYLKSNPDKKILLIESKTRLGGRILTANHNNEIYEIGAGRFSDKHILLNDLLKELKLETKVIPIHSDISFFSKEGQFNSKLKFDSVLSKVITLINKHFNQSNQSNYDTLYHKTLYKILKDLDPILADQMNHIYSYYSELHIMNAHDALESFKKDFKTTTPYNVLGGGLGQIIEELEKKIKKKVKIILGDDLIDLELDQDKRWKLIMSSGKEYLTSGLVLALPQKPLLELSALKPIYPLLKYVSGQPLYRIYARFEKNWLTEKIVTDSSLKFIIPVNNTGLVMISYTDGPLTEKWINVIIENKLEETLINELKKVFPSIDIPKILWTDASGYWEVGAHYWKPRKTWLNQELLIKKINHPFDNVYIIGEAFSSNQAWIEGALKTTQLALKDLEKTPFPEQNYLDINQKNNKKNSITIKTYTIEDVAQHNTIHNAWMVIKGKVYDVTKWIGKHPGGNIITKGLGIDATELFIKFGHSSRAEKILKNYQIGIINK